ncbi:MAG: hypothetical protein HY289_02070 [Planctomycetes bacterium]|nr:hypothetical protein [Planctomycetota bacterium]
MSIVLTCPKCDETFKVKDALAGRKVKSPCCGKSVSVPADDDDPDPPAKKGKKAAKAGMSMGLIIGLVAGAGVLVLLLIVGVIVTIVIVNRNKTPTPDVAGNNSKTDPAGNNPKKLLPGEVPEQTADGRLAFHSTLQKDGFGSGASIQNLTVPQGVRVTLTIKCEPSDAKTTVTAYLRSMDDVTKKKTMLVQKDNQGGDFRIEYTGTGDVIDMIIQNNGPGTVKCTVYKK